MKSCYHPFRQKNSVALLSRMEDGLNNETGHCLPTLPVFHFLGCASDWWLDMIIFKVRSDPEVL